MKIIPVIDIQRGLVVHGVAGQRDGYRPIQSHWTVSTQPVDVLHCLQQTFGLTDFYVADLDAIEHQRSDGCLLARLQQAEGRMYCDAGVRSLTDAVRMADLQVDQIVLGLESLPAPEIAGQLLNAYGADRLVFSLDMHNQRPLLSGDAWQADHIRDIFQTVADLGFDRFLVLDLATVGTESGLSTLELCRHIRTQMPHAHLLCGGGVRAVSDLEAAEQAGVDGVLVASALHHRMLSPADVRRFHGP